MLETALGADLERFGNAQLQLLKLTPVQASLLADGRPAPAAPANTAPAASAPATAVPGSTPALAAGAAAPSLAGSGAAGAGLLPTPSGIPEPSTAGNQLVHCPALLLLQQKMLLYGE